MNICIFYLFEMLEFGREEHGDDGMMDGVGVGVRLIDGLLGLVILVCGKMGVKMGLLFSTGFVILLR